MNATLIERVKRIGLTEYEARAYLVLLNLGRCTAREIGENAEIPKSRVYSVLKDLQEKKFLTTLEGMPTYYQSQDPDQVLTRIRDKKCEEINDLKKVLKNCYYEINSSSPFWPIYTEQGIETMVRTLIISSQKEILVMLSKPQHLRPYIPFLKKSSRRIDLHILVPDKRLFSGSGLKITEMGEELLQYLDGMYTDQGSLHTCIESLEYDNHDDELVFFIDWTKAISIGYKEGQRCATLIRIPTFCYLYRSVISIFEPKIGGLPKKASISPVPLHPVPGAVWLTGE